MTLSRRGRYALCLLLAPALLCAATGRGLRQDMDYYRRVADAKNLGANDRLYILYRLQSKYAGSGLDLSSVDGEVRRWEEAKKSGRAPAPAPKPKPAGPPSLTRLRREESGGLVKVIMELSAPVIPQAFRVEDPESGALRLVIDLPKVRDGRDRKARDARWDDGPLAALTVPPAADRVRVQLELRGEPAYKVIRSRKKVFVELSPGEAAAARGRPGLSDGETPPAAPETSAQAEEADSTAVIQAGDLVDIRISPLQTL